MARDAGASRQTVRSDVGPSEPPRGAAARRPKTPEERDEIISAFLKRAQAAPPAAWTGSETIHREHAPAYFQYPAMMSPAVQRDLLNLILKASPDAGSVIDPFCGSGTVLSEAMYAGLECWASDLNPLAVLLCKVKSGDYDAGALNARRKDILKRVDGDQSQAIDTTLSNWKKWFRPRAARELSALRRSIRRVRSPTSRQFFWACLAETVRRTSNSRTSTYKLHIRPSKEIEEAPWPLDTFKEVSEANIEKHAKIGRHLRKLGYLSRGRFYKPLEICQKDASTSFPRAFDILMTSPPYGDNVSTVPYGQSAYLPLNWIDLRDIGKEANKDILKSTHEIDRRSLGGERPRWRDVKALRAMRQRSTALDRFLRQIATKPHDRTTRVLGFLRDMEKALPTLLTAVRPNGYMVWTLGNRRVGGREVPFAQILIDLLRERSVFLVGRCTRRIPQKRMAFRNSISPTMKLEHLLVFRRVAAKSIN